MSQMSLTIYFVGRGIRFQQKKLSDFFLHIHGPMNLYFCDICTCKVSISKIISVVTSAIPILRVILTGIPLSCITFMI